MPGSLVPRDLPRLAALIRHGIRCGSGRGAGGQDLGLGEHVLLLEPLRQGVDHRQCIVGAVVLIAHEPAAAPERADQFGVGDVLQFPSIVPAVALQAPDLAALDDVQRDIAHQLVHMAKPLGAAVQAYVVVAAAQQRGQKRRVDVVPERPAVQLDAQFVHAGNGHGQGIVLVIVGLVDLAGGHDLRQAAQLLIGHSQRHIGEDEHPLGDELAPARAPDGFTVVTFIQAGDLVDQRQCFTGPEIPAVDVEVTGVAAIIIFMAQIGKAVQYAILEDVQRMGYGAAHGGEQRHHDDRTNGQNQAPHGTTSTATSCGRCRTSA